MKIPTRNGYPVGWLELLHADCREGINCVGHCVGIGCRRQTGKTARKHARKSSGNHPKSPKFQVR